MTVVSDSDEIKNANSLFCSLLAFFEYPEPVHNHINKGKQEK